MRRFLYSLILIAVLFGSPYAAWLLNRVMGPWNAGLGERDGSVSQVSFDPSMPPVSISAWRWSFFSSRRIRSWVSLIKADEAPILGISMEDRS